MCQKQFRYPLKVSLTTGRVSLSTPICWIFSKLASGILSETSFHWFIPRQRWPSAQNSTTAFWKATTQSSRNISKDTSSCRRALMRCSTSIILPIENSDSSGAFTSSVSVRKYIIIELSQSNVPSFVSGLTRQNCLGKLEAECQGGTQEKVCEDRQHQHKRAEQLPRYPPPSSWPDQRGTGLQNNLKLL